MMRSSVAPAYLNSVFAWNISILIVFMATVVVGRHNANLFSKKKIGNVRDRTGFAQTHPSNSAIHCAASCQKTSECQTFSFDKKTKTCKMGNASTESRRMYRKPGNMTECPEQKGYLLWIYSATAYCLKYYAVKLVQPAARQICNDDGGNLALIDSDLKRLRLHDISTELVVPANQWILWFDGYDMDNQNKFSSWKGNELSVSQWLGGQPTDSNDQECVGAMWREQFLLRNGRCQGHTLHFFCEIEFS